MRGQNGWNRVSQWENVKNEDGDVVVVRLPKALGAKARR